MPHAMERGSDGAAGRWCVGQLRAAALATLHIKLPHASLATGVVRVDPGICLQ